MSPSPLSSRFRPGRSALTATALIGVLALAACGGKADPANTASEAGSPAAGASSGSSDAASPSGKAEDGTVIEVEVEGDTISPNGSRVKAKVDTPITFKITADAAGELHAHTTPESEIAYPKGTSEHTLTIDQPGVYEIESHDLGIVVVQLEVS